MRCPNCGKEISDGQSYCNACGSVLYGPRNVNLNNPGKAVGSAQSNDISSITGIDINSLSYDIGDDVDYNDGFNQQEEKKEPKKLNIHLDKGTIILVSVIVILLGLCIFLFIRNSSLKKQLGGGTEVQDCKETENVALSEEIVKKYVTGYYGLAGYYAFTVPNNWRYSEASDGYTALSNDNDMQMLIVDSIAMEYSQLNKEKIIAEYYSQGFLTATIGETKIGNFSVIYVDRFNDVNKKYYTDFYMDYNGSRIVYGQIYSDNEKAIENVEIQTILKSIIVLEKKNSLAYPRYKVDYNNILTIKDQQA